MSGASDGRPGAGRPGRSRGAGLRSGPSSVGRSRVSLTARLVPVGGDEADALAQLEHLSVHRFVPDLVETQLDMSALTRCSPDLLAAVRELRDRMDERGGVLTFRGPVADVVLEALDSAPLHDVFAFYAMIRPPGRTPQPTH